MFLMIEQSVFLLNIIPFSRSGFHSIYNTFRELKLHTVNFPNNIDVYEIVLSILKNLQHLMLIRMYLPGQ